MFGGNWPSSPHPDRVCALPSTLPRVSQPGPETEWQIVRLHSDSHGQSIPSFHCESQTPSRSTSTQSGLQDKWHGHVPFEQDSTPLGSIHIRTRNVAVCTTKCPSNREVLDRGHQESDMDGSGVRLPRGDQQEFHHRVAVNSMGTKGTTFIKKESSADQKAWWHREVREERHTPQIHHQLLQKDTDSDRMRFDYGTPSVQSRCSRSANKTRKRRKRPRTQTRKHETVAKKNNAHLPPVWKLRATRKKVSREISLRNVNASVGVCKVCKMGGDTTQTNSQRLQSVVALG